MDLRYATTWMSNTHFTGINSMEEESAKCLQPPSGTSEHDSRTQQPGDKITTKGDSAVQPPDTAINVVSADEPIRLNLMAAMCHVNRGISYRQNLPWPPLKDDFEYYTRMTSSPRHSEGKKIVHILGRLTWATSGDVERRFPGVRHVIISNTMRHSEFSHPTVIQIVSSFEEAVQFCNDHQDEIDSVWVMGGVNVYQSALNHAQFGKLYLTHVYKDFPADRFFPPFEHLVHEVSEQGVKQETVTNSGIEFQFKVYERNTCSL